MIGEICLKYGNRKHLVRAKVKVTPNSYYAFAHLHSPSNGPIKYHLLTPYIFQDIAGTRFYRSRSLWQNLKVESRSDHETADVHSQPMTLSSINFLYLTISEIYPKQNFKGQGHYSKGICQIKATPYPLAQPPRCNGYKRYPHRL